MNKPNCYIALERRRMTTTGLNTGKFHVKLWVTFIVIDGCVKKHKQRPYKTGVFCTADEFDMIMDRSLKRVPILISDMRHKLDEIERRARHIIDKLGISKQDQFETFFLSDYRAECVAPYIKEKIEELKRAKKYSSAEKYGTTLYTFTEFFESELFTFDQLNEVACQDYENWYIEQDYGDGKKSLTTVGINMRNLRHIFRRVIKRGIISESLYPFGLEKYIIPEGGDDTKRFLDTNEKALFLSWRTVNDRQAELYDYARFCYFSYGINLSDFARLRRSDIMGDYISIDRQKTKGRKKKAKKLIIPMHPTMQEIINKHGKKSLIPNDFVFPILNVSMDEESIFYAIRDLVSDVNDVLAVITKDLKLSVKVTSYVLRHTFSYHFMQLGASTDELQDALAHGTARTTENYKHGFSIERKKKLSQGL